MTQDSNGSLALGVIGGIVGAWFLGAIPVGAFILINLALSFIFDVRYLPKELMGSESEVALLVGVIPLAIGGSLIATFFWFNRDTYDGLGTDSDADASSEQETFDDFGVSCFQTGLVEEHDPRTAQSFGEVAEIRAAMDRGDNKAALELARQSHDNYPDFFLFPCLAADVFLQDGDLDGAIRTLTTALDTCLSKTNICDRLGVLARKQGKTAEALRWWIVAAHIQLSSGRLVNWPPLLKLSYVADGFELHNVQRYLKYKADNLSPAGPVDFNDQEAASLRGMANDLPSLEKDSVRHALKFLVSGRSLPVKLEDSAQAHKQIHRVANVSATDRTCPVCDLPMVNEPNYVHCENGHAKIVVDPMTRCFLARSRELADVLQASGFRVESSGGDRPMYSIYPP